MTLHRSLMLVRSQLSFRRLLKLSPVSKLITTIGNSTPDEDESKQEKLR